MFEDNSYSKEYKIERLKIIAKRKVELEKQVELQTNKRSRLQEQVDLLTRSILRMEGIYTELEGEEKELSKPEDSDLPKENDSNDKQPPKKQ